LTQLGVAKSDKVAIEEHLTEELKSKEKLIVLYRNKAEAENKQVTQLQSTVDGLKSLLDRTNHETQKEREIALQEREELRKKNQQLLTEIEQLKVKIDSGSTTNELFSEEDLRQRIKELAPENSSKYLELLIITEQKYEHALAVLQKEKNENRQRENYLKQILHTLEEMGPSLAKE